MSDEQDAARYRWLVAQLQTAYGGNDLEIGDITIGCCMQYARKSERRVLGTIIWIDERDEPLNLDTAIDEAMRLERKHD